MRRQCIAIGLCLLALSCGSNDDDTGAASSGGTAGSSGAGGSSGSSGDGGSTGGLPDPVGCAPGAPITPGTHEYFETLRARPECHVALSLRDAKQVGPDTEGGYSGHGGPLSVTYDPDNDTYPDKQDAAKIVVPPDKNSLPNQVHVPIRILHGERAFITWDAWFGPEFDFANHQIPNYKMWQFCSHTDGIWAEVRAGWKFGPTLGPGALAGVDTRTYSEVVGPIVTSKAPLEPQLAPFTLMQKRWVRYFALFEPDGEYDAYSLWMADAETDPVHMFDRVPLQFRSNKAGTATPQLGVFRVEFNTSHNDVLPGRSELIAYVRNYIVLKGDMDIAPIIVRPIP
jgi:hypothetical protein